MTKKRAPEFLDVEDVLALHAESIRRFGGALGVRDVGLLESAIAVPQATFSGKLLQQTLEEQAAAYLFHLVQNHPFLDGNKRAGLAAALAFLGMNGVWISASGDDLVAVTIGVAAGRLTKADVAVFLREHAEPWRGR